MALRKIYLLLLLSLSLASNAQTADTSFKNEWLGIDTLIIAHDLTKTALDKVNILYQKAKQKQLQGQLVKCLLYQYSLQERIISNEPNPALKITEEELAGTNDEIQRAILHSLLAKLYKQYFDNHRWNLYGRKKTTGFIKTDITTWGVDDFTSVITKHYLLSLLKKELLKQRNTDIYNPVILKGNIPGVTTLFDLLTHEALSYFKTGEAAISKAIDTFILNDTTSLSNTDQFIKSAFTTKDSSSQTWISLQLFQQLLSAHQNDAAKDIFVENNLERIEWVYEKAGFLNKEIHYKKALEEITQINSSCPAAAQAWYLLARQEFDKASAYTAFGDTTNHYGFEKAKQLSEKALSQYTENSRGVINLKNLLLDINHKELSTQTESVNIPGKPFRALVSYRNVDTVFFRIIQIARNRNLRNEQSDSGFWKKITSLNPYQFSEQVLPVTNDHQPHAVEIKLGNLPVGEYALISSNRKTFDEKNDKLCIQPFFISNISYVQNRQDIFVVNRETGKPVANVKVEIYQQNYQYQQRKSTYEKLAGKTTDERGYFKVDKQENKGNLRFVFTKGNDRLDMMRTQFIPFVNDEPDVSDERAARYERNSNHIFFFTDRSIYRPGQTVFFKGIAVTRDYRTKLSKLMSRKDSSWVYLINVNGDKTDSMRFALNDFGSFNGSFRLPQNGLTGRFSITVPAFTYTLSGADFSVEEYKRPNFDISFEKTKGSYRLNDSVTITGNAMAYAGNTIDGAKVVYTVKRGTRFIEPFYWRKTGTLREISHGELKTDAMGKFIIRFKAMADDITDKSGNPQFDFSIAVDVTDINGETRSSQTSLTVGFSSLLLNVMLPYQAETDSLKKIHINCTNLSYEKEPAKVHLKMYALQVPGHLIRKRYWKRPDQFVMDKKEFNRYFPTDEYEEESNMQTWPIGELVKDAVVDTKDADSLPVIPGLLKPGYYKIEASALDKYGVEVKTTGYTRLFSRNITQPGNPFYQFYHTINGSAKPGETASFITGSAADHIYVIRKTESPKQKLAAYTFTERNKGFENLTYTPDETERGGVNISEVFVIDNRVYAHQYMITVPWNNKELQVQYASYRNKTEPGSQEKWTVTVQTDKHEVAAAELLTGMYDASLDQFKPHQWATPSVWQANYPSGNFTGYSNFGNETSIENSMPEDRFDELPVNHDQLASSADELWNRNLIQWINDSSLNIPVSLRQSLRLLNEATVTRYGVFQKKDLSEKEISLRGISSIDQNKSAGKLTVAEVVLNKAAAAFASPATLTDEEIRTEEVENTDNRIAFVPRKNFNETAFFFPQLYADTSGKYSFSFTMPDALTQWKWMSVAHTKDLAFGSYRTHIITRKKLMVQPNAPRFLREGDNMEFSAKIVNLSDKEITGQVSFELIDAVSNTSVDGWFQNVFPSQYFTVEAGKSFPLKFPIQVPFSYNRPLTWRMIAKAGEFSDGEENTLPVLTNRVLVTESLPLFLQGDTTQQFTFEKLVNTGSETLSHEGITVEYTSNPVWYAVQALPYLMEFPYECAEQTFNRFYANSLASFIVNKNPKIKQVFDQWKADSTTLKSNLQKNEELKQVLLQETPWVMQAENEEEQKKSIAWLFDMARLSNQTESSLEKLLQLQLPDGSFSWFKGGSADRYMTNYILTGIGKLKRLGALSPDMALRIRNILVNAIKYSDSKIAEDYHWLIRNKADLTKQQVSGVQIDYLYMRSFFRDIARQSPEAYDFYYKQGKQFWIKQNSYYRAQLGLICLRNKDEKFATGTILPALQENAINDPKLGMYWKSAYAGYWYQSPIEHQSMMIAFMSEINTNESLTKKIDAMKTWLLLNKQTSNWKTTIATADACYALLLNGSDWLNTERKITIRLGNYSINSHNEKTAAGTGYFKKRIEGKQVTPEMGNISVSTNSSISKFPNSKISQSPSWGSVYWQYFEDMDKVTAAASPLSITKKLFIEKNTDKGKVRELIKESDELKTGDKVVIRMELRSDRDMDYLHLKDMRASSMEPVNVLSSYQWQDGLGYYESTKDASSNFFISHLSKGTYVFEYPVFITHTGLFSVGLATIQCMYAPEFSGHSEGLKIRVAD